MAEESELRVKKASLKGRLTRFYNFIIDDCDRDNLNDETVSEIESRLEKFEPLLNEFSNVISQLIALENANQAQLLVEEQEFESKFFKVISKARLFCKIFYNKSDTNSVVQSNASLQQSVFSNTNNNLKPIVKLPPITIPTFNGSYCSWLEFKDTFISLVDQNIYLDDTQKFYYLRLSLEKNVLEVIQSVEVTANNYQVAWQILKDRFENKALMIHNHIHSIFDIPKLTTESHKELRNLYDSVTKHLRALKSLGENTDSWDRLIIYILANKFDLVTRRDWENYKFQGELPNLEDINKFLKSKCDILGKIEITCQEKVPFLRKRLNSHGFPVLNDENRKFKCYYCNQNHSIFKCETFAKLNPDKKIDAVKKLKLCLNCLRPSHPSWKCNLSKCMKCHKAHNTILHSEKIDLNKNKTDGGSGSANSQQESTSPSADSTIAAAARAISSDVAATYDVSCVLLSTVKIYIKKSNKLIECRALLDNGSQSNFITESLSKRLNLQSMEIKHAVKGIGNSLANINKKVNIEITSCVNRDFTKKIDCLVLEKITDKLPIFSFNKNKLNIPPHIELADPEFNVSQQIDLLLGSEIFWSILKPDQKLLGDKLPVLQNTEFGWIVAGSMVINNSSGNSINCLSTLQGSTLDKDIIKFWELEEVDNQERVFSEAENYCERFFEQTTIKNKDGRYVVKIPFKNSVSHLGLSRDNALQRLYSLERKLNKSAELKRDYTNFMTEYLGLNHMSEYNDSNNKSEGYYLPHHAVVKNTSLTTKLRTVFDASCKTTSGLSLNDVQFTGPTLQQDIFDILLRFRTYKYVMTGDISKMYRQILVNESDRKYQKILWRPNPDDDIKCYKLNTVTYGTASAPYLAVKCLFDIADQNKNDEIISTVIKRDFYMDDLITGADTLQDILYIQGQVSKILAKSGFELRKWLCNDKELLNQFEVNDNLDVSILNIGNNEPNKTLGILWDAPNDLIRYKVNLEKCTSVTKRSVLSIVSQIFDPLGLLGPVIVIAKLIIQDIWRQKLEWDDELPATICKKWSEFRNNIVIINDLKINRYVTISHYINIELHGFSDASIKAYGACLYLRCEVRPGEYICNILCAKSRVAPLKQVSLPRLELCAAQLLANLVKKVKGSLNIKFNKFYYWSDSTITLCWIRGESSSWKTFVANRVSEIQSLTEKINWYYVPSGENPADVLSRGIKPQALSDNNLWWHGPSFLLKNKDTWNFTDCQLEEEIPEQKSLSHLASTKDGLICQLYERCSSLLEMLHVLSYMFRFLSILKNKNYNNHEIINDALLPEEMNKSLRLLIREAQIEVFPREYKNLSLGKPVPNNSKILCLNPIFKDKLICVGGRLRNANQSDEAKHPIILPNSHKLTKYILENEHKRLLHCGAQTLLYSIREKYWPLTGRSICRAVVKKCLNCFRANPKNINYLMGDLPEVRVKSFGVFENVGTDYGGPFYIKNKRGRGAKVSKCYICLFICMCTKAVHIELVSDLTTESFLAALNRFTHRRGKPSNIYSDNGLNYIGANNELNKIYEFLKENAEYIGTKLVDENIKWHFIPANSPTFGGLWESGIKSTKSHIKRVFGTKAFTFEEFATLLVQIEGVLNSRPLCPLTEDPEDCLALTPAHFLIGRTLTALPEYSLTDINEGKLSRWQHIQSMVQHYWKRWQKEYLGELQTRTKWRKNCENVLKVGSLVLVKDDNAPLLQWPLGRITELHYGSDDIVRVVTVRVRSNEIKRAVNRICVLPIDIEN